MAFENFRKHNLAHIAFLQREVKRGTVDARLAMEVATLLVQQGLHELADAYMARQCSDFTHPDAKAFIASLKHQNRTIAGIHNLPEVLNDKPLMLRLLDESEPVFVPGTRTTENLLVVFCTTYNNFYVSNAVLLSLIKQSGCSVLFLKDSDANFYLKGSKDFGGSLIELTTALQEFVRHWKIRRVHCMGFSSSGYAALFAAITLNQGPYLGFSIRTDYSLGASLPQGWLMRDELKTEIAAENLVNLAAMHGARAFQHVSNVYYGEDDEIDCLHARNLNGCQNMTLHAIPKTGHSVPARLLETDAFEKIILDFLAS